MLFKDSYWLCCTFTCIIHAYSGYYALLYTVLCYVTIIDFYYTFIIALYLLVFLQMRSVILLINEYDDDDDVLVLTKSRNWILGGQVTLSNGAEIVKIG